MPSLQSIAYGSHIMPSLPDSLQLLRPGSVVFLAVAIVFIAAEYLYARLSQHDEDHDVSETAASFGVAVGDVSPASLPVASRPYRSCSSTSTGSSKFR
jgi:hypothetical protein